MTFQWIDVEDLDIHDGREEKNAKIGRGIEEEITSRIKPNKWRQCMVNEVAEANIKRRRRRGLHRMSAVVSITIASMGG